MSPPARVSWLVVCLPLLVAHLFIATAASAQVSTGGIRGVVRDEQGQALRGVTITAEGPALIGVSVATVSNDQGVFQFEALPVGLYTLTFTLPKFKTTRYPDARVEVGRTIEHDATLAIGAVAESVTVAASRSVIDAAHAGTSTVFNRQLIDNVPTTRASYFDTITFAPGVKTDQSPNVAVFNIFGSSADQNSYQYQGVDISAPSFGSPWDFPNFDIMQEVEVRSIGASAEYSGFQGGVVNIVTRSGSNDWAGAVSYFFVGNSLVGNNTPNESFPFTTDYRHDLSAQFGGPIRLNRLWVNGIVQFNRIRESDVGVDPALAPVLRRVRPFAKVTASLTPRDVLEVMVTDNNFRSPNAASRTSPPETILVEHGHNPVIVGRWLRQFGSGSLFELRAGGIYIRDRLDPYSGDLVTPGRFDFADGTSHDNAGYTWWERENKTTVDASLARPVNGWIGGQHAFKFGLQTSFGTARTNDAYLQNVFYYDFAGPFLEERHQPSGTGGRVTTIGGFVQDDWSATGRMTLNLGLRLDRTTAGIPEISQYDDTSRESTGVSFPAVDDLIAVTHVSPRLGMALRLDESARTVAKASYGRYYGKLNTNMFSAVSPGNTSFDGFEFNAATGEYDIPSYSVGSGQAMSVDPHLKNQYTDQFSIGVERQIVGNFGVDVIYLHKREREPIRQKDVGGVYVPVSMTDEFNGRTQTLTLYALDSASQSHYLLTNRPEMKQSYHAIVVQGYKRWSEGWQLHASYVWQRARGYASGEIGINAHDFSTFGDAKNFGRDPNDLTNAYGPLPTDSSHAIRLAMTYQAPYGIQLASRYVFESGRPYGRVVNALDLPQGVRPVLAEPRGAYHLPALNDLQLRINKDLMIRGVQRVRLSLDIFNLFNSDTPLTVRNNSSEAGADFGQTLSVFAPRRAMVGLRVEF
jgi:hypothetical protein